MQSIKRQHSKRTGSKSNLKLFLPTSRQEMKARGWDELDILILTGDAYVDHPAFGSTLISRFLESKGYRVGLIAQPDWKNTKDISRMGRPRLFVGVTSGNLDSMLNKFTAQKKVRSEDPYTPSGKTNARPNRATVVYSNLCKQAFKGLPVILGGIEASLRRLAHYDYWSDNVRRSILLDAKADLLVFGMGESAIEEVAHRLNKSEQIDRITNVRGTAYVINSKDEWQAILQNPSQRITDNEAVVLPSYQEVCSSKHEYALASRMSQNETNPGNARPLLQMHGEQAVFLNPPAIPLTQNQMDALYDLPFECRPHYQNKGTIKAYETIKHSIVSSRGCFGGCSFCSLSEHQGRIIQSRSIASILREVNALQQLDDFNGVITDIGSPTANMYMMRCKSARIEKACRRLSCLHPKACKNLDTNHNPFIDLLKEVRQTQGIKKVYIASGIRYDLAEFSPDFIEQLAMHHTGGMLSVAPEHNNSDVLQKMKKPGIELFERFCKMFERSSKKVNKEQYVIPYLIVAHPGSTLLDTIDLALYLKRKGLRPRQVQEFIPTPMSMSTSMYYSDIDPVTMKPVRSIKDLREKRLMKALLFYWDETKWHLAREALKKAERQDLIGNSQKCLIPPEHGPSERRRPGKPKSEKNRDIKPDTRASRHQIRHQSDRIQRRRTPRTAKK